MKTTAMLRRHIWLTLGLLPFLSAGVLGATDEREHVHIKVRMPEVVRKHPHYQHRAHKHPHQHHHHPPMHPHDYAPSATAPYTKKKVKPALPPLHNHIDLDWSAAAGAPQLQQLAPILPALVPDESDLAPNYGPALFDNDIIDNYVHSNNNPNANQQQQPLPSPTVAALQAMMSVPTTQQQQQQQQQLMQHMELMGALAAAAAAGGGSGGGVEGAATNTLLVDDFLAELQRLYANSKYTIAPQQLMPHRILRHTATPVAPRTVSATKQRHKRKKYRDTYQQQQHQQQLQQQYYANYYQQQQQPQLFNANNIYANAVASGDLNDDDNGDNDDDEEDLDDATTAAAATYNTANDYSAADESMEKLNGHAAVNPVSYQQLVDAYQQQQLQPTATTRLEWRPQQQQQKHFKHLQQQDETQFVLPTVHYRQQHIKTAQPINVADSGAGGVSITAAGSDFEEPAMQQQQQQQQQRHQQQQQQHQQHQSSTRYKKRKNRIKRKRNRIVVQ